MIAIGTDVLVRWITRDDEHQAVAADRVMEQPVAVSPTVLVEMARVLGGAGYEFDRVTLAATLRNVLDTQTICIEQEAQIRWCIERLAAGAGFADMVPPVATRGASGFATFDRRLAGRAGPNAPLPIDTLS